MLNLDSNLLLNMNIKLRYKGYIRKIQKLQYCIKSIKIFIKKIAYNIQES